MQVKDFVETPKIQVPQSYTPFLLIVILAMGVVLLCQALMYFFVYKGQDYRDIRKEQQRQQNKLNKQKNKNGPQKKINKIQDRLNQINAQLMRVKLKGFLITAVLSIGTIKLMGSYFSGYIVAFLPFQPFNFMKNLTQSGLHQPNPKDCGYLFIYILSTIIFRSLAQLILDLQNKSIKKD